MQKGCHDHYSTPPKVFASAATGIVEHIERNKGDADNIFGRVGIRQKDIGDPLYELNLIQYCNLFEVAVNNTGNDNFGLEFGQKFFPRHLGPIGYVAISSPTLYTALSNMMRYFAVHQGQTSFGIIQDGDILWLSYRIYDERIQNRRQDAELSLGMFCNIFKNALGNEWTPVEVRFEHDRPDDMSNHENSFRAPVKFGRRTNAIAFRRNDLDVRMPEQDACLNVLITAFLDSRCKMVEDIGDFANVVRNQIKLHLGEAPLTFSEMGRVLGLSKYSFHKQLKTSGLSFRDLLQAARQELALHYMDEQDMQLTEIAYNLGYSELSAFSRAFRAWTGMSPQSYRGGLNRKIKDL